MDLISYIIASIGLYIAYRQHINDRYRINIDLFEKRYEVYLLMGNVLATLIQGLPKDDPKGFTLARDIGIIDRKSKFIFPYNVKSEIASICSKSMRLMELYRLLRDAKSGGLEDGIKRNEAAEEKRLLFRELSEKFQNLEDVFISSMNLTR